MMAFGEKYSKEKIIGANTMNFHIIENPYDDYPLEIINVGIGRRSR